MSTAVLVDGGFFLKRYRVLYPHGKTADAKIVARDLFDLIAAHHKNDELYRVFYYDSVPFAKKVHHPLTNRTVDFAQTPQAKFRLELFEELKRKRKFALRLGELRDHGQWQIFPERLRELLTGKIQVSQLQQDDLFYELRQKGVDIKIGVDIATITLKKLVRRIILISGDGDFIPAAKLARREGVDFVLDPLWNQIDPALYEHIDGLQTTAPKPATSHPNAPVPKS